MTFSFLYNRGLTSFSRSRKMCLHQKGMLPKASTNLFLETLDRSLRGENPSVIRTSYRLPIAIEDTIDISLHLFLPFFSGGSGGGYAAARWISE